MTSHAASTPVPTGMEANPAADTASESEATGNVTDDSEQSEAAYQAGSLFPIPAAPTQTKLQAALETAMQRKQAATIAKEAYANHLHDVVFEADAEQRVDIDADVDALLNAANNNAVSRELAAMTQAMRAEKADMMRRVQEVVGIQAIKLVDEEKFDVAIDKIVRDNASLSEAVRLICAAAGTVRVDEYVPVTRKGVTKLQRVFADIGDEEAGQTPIVDVRYMLTAALKASIRFKRLMAEAQESAALAHRFESMFNDKAVAFNSLHGEYQELLRDFSVLEAAELARGEPATFAPTVIRVTDGTYYLALRPGVEPKLAWAYRRTTDVRKALVFDSVEQAQAILHKISISKFRHLSLDKLEPMRVVRVVTENHGWGSDNGSQMAIPSYPPMLPAIEGVAPITRPDVSGDSAPEAVAGTNSRVKSYNVSAREDDKPKAKGKGKSGKSSLLSRMKAKNKAKADAVAAPVTPAISPARQKSLAAALLAKRSKTS